MRASTGSSPARAGLLRLRLPATSANLGPGFDSLGLALSLFLEIEAEGANKTGIQAIGRSPELTADTERSLIITTYREMLRGSGIEPPHLELKLRNGIPLGMGCGSSAAALLAGVHLANHFGFLGWTADQVLAEACRREGHPDNVAACALGGLTVSVQAGTEVVTATLGLDLRWAVLLAVPGRSLATEEARALLPGTYSRGDAVANIQRASLLTAAFALDRPDLLRVAMEDRMHQPYRVAVCPLLPRLLPLAGRKGIHGVALSGAGPSILLFVDPAAEIPQVEAAVYAAAEDPSLELLWTKIAGPAEVIAP